MSQKRDLLGLIGYNSQISCLMCNYMVSEARHFVALVVFMKNVT